MRSASQKHLSVSYTFHFSRSIVNINKFDANRAQHIFQVEVEMSEDNEADQTQEIPTPV